MQYTLVGNVSCLKFNKRKREREISVGTLDQILKTLAPFNMKALHLENPKG